MMKNSKLAANRHHLSCIGIDSEVVSGAFLLSLPPLLLRLVLLLIAFLYTSLQS